MSTAILARRKMGKTAIMERLFNITFFKNDGVVPFYYEIKENDVWLVDFCIDFCLTFVYQYIAFKTRNTRYLRLFDKSNLDKAMQLARSEGLDYFLPLRRRNIAGKKELLAAKMRGGWKPGIKVVLSAR